jgi:hypothetical protein
MTFVCLCLVRLPSLVQCLLFHEISSSHRATHHSRYDSSERVIRSLQRPLLDKKIHNRQTSVSPVVFEPTILAVERTQTCALDRTATATGTDAIDWRKILRLLDTAQCSGWEYRRKQILGSLKRRNSLHPSDFFLQSGNSWFPKHTAIFRVLSFKRLLVVSTNVINTIQALYNRIFVSPNNRNCVISRYTLTYDTFILHYSVKRNTIMPVTLPFYIHRRFAGYPLI